MSNPGVYGTLGFWFKPQLKDPTLKRWWDDIVRLGKHEIWSNEEGCHKVLVCPKLVMIFGENV